jgi:hypothetical protein
MAAPDSFHQDHADEWAQWVLDDGLPELPPEVRVGECVPVACWAGPRFGAVARVEWWLDDDGDADEGPSLMSEDFRRTADGWEQSGHAGGEGCEALLARPECDPRFAEVLGWSESSASGWECRSVDGMAGSDAAFVEVEDADGVTRTPFTSPVGVFVACMSTTADAVLRVLDGRERPFFEQRFDRLPPRSDDPIPDAVLLIVPHAEFDDARAWRDPSWHAIAPVAVPPTREDASNLRLAVGDDDDPRYRHVVVVARDPGQRKILAAAVRETIPGTLRAARLSTCEPPFSPDRCQPVDR